MLPCIHHARFGWMATAFAPEAELPTASLHQLQLITLHGCLGAGLLHDLHAHPVCIMHMPTLNIRSHTAHPCLPRPTQVSFLREEVDKYKKFLQVSTGEWRGTLTWSLAGLPPA